MMTFYLLAIVSWDSFLEIYIRYYHSDGVYLLCLQEGSGQVL